MDADLGSARSLVKHPTALFLLLPQIFSYFSSVLICFSVFTSQLSQFMTFAVPFCI